MIIGSKLIFVEELSSTNTHASELLIDNDLPEGTVIYTNYQSSGRGQTGNRWESEYGMNLLISIILHPARLNPAFQFFLSMVISLGICDFLERYTKLCSIKWPNDIYIKNDKIAGILIENTIMAGSLEKTIAGIGLNINQKKFESDAPNPVSLGLIHGQMFDLKVCLNQLCADLDKRYKQLISEDFTKIKREYVLQLYRFNEWCEFRDKETIYTGRILDVKESGRLCIEKKSGDIVDYSFREVDFIP